MPDYVYQLRATGVDGMTGNSQRSIYTTTVFTTEEKAAKRIPMMREKMVDGFRLMPEGINIEILPLEIVE